MSVAIIVVGIRHFGVKLPQCGTNMRESGKMVEIQVAEILTKRLGLPLAGEFRVKWQKRT